MDLAQASSFEQDLLWSVLDQDSVPHILDMAREHWTLDPAAAWAAIQAQSTAGRLRAYREAEPERAVDLSQTSLEDARRDFGLFVEPTEATHARLGELSGGALASGLGSGLASRVQDS